MITKILMRGRKRLILSEDDIIKKQIRRTIQNKINKSNQRIRDKNKRNILTSLTMEQREKEYIENLITFFNTYEFDIHFTGTFNPKNTKKVSLQSLKSYTDRFIQLLIQGNIIEYGLVFLDTGENENNHSHMIMKSKENNKNIHNLIKSKWMLGNNVNVKDILTDEQKLNTIKYGFKKIENTYNRNRMKLDSWTFIKN
jgi:hypothetical protein